MRCPLIVLMFLAISAPLWADATPAAPPEPETFLAEGQYTDYAQQAQDFLNSQPDSPAAPRVALDLLVTASYFQDQGSAVKMRRLLVSRYPSSIQGRFVIGTLFRDGADFASVMAEMADENFVKMPVSFPSQYDTALQLGVARFGASALGEGPTLVREYVLTSLAGDKRLADATAQLIAASGPAAEQWKQALVDFMTGNEKPLARLKKLHLLTDRAAAEPFEDFILTRLSDADKNSAEVEEIEADDKLADGQLADALPFLNKMAPTDPRLIFWQAWATAAGGDVPTADVALRNLAAAHPDDPWGKEANDLDPAVSGVELSLAKDVDAALAASRFINSGLDMLEGHINYTRPDGVKVDLYVGYNAGNLLELLGKEDEKTVFGYRATDTDASLFCRGFPSIVHFGKPPPLLYCPRVALVRYGNGYTLRVDPAHFTYSYDELAKFFSTFASSDIVSTRSGLTDLMRSLIHQGIFPMPPASQPDGSTVYTWVSPAVSTPTVAHVSVTVGPDGTITGFQTDTFSVSGIRYGKAGSIVLSYPPLPQLPLKEAGAIQTSILQQVLPIFINMYNPPPPATQPSTQPATQPATQP